MNCRTGPIRNKLPLRFRMRLTDQERLHLSQIYLQACFGPNMPTRTNRKTRPSPVYVVTIFISRSDVVLPVIAKRSPAAPDVPTIAESGVPGYAVDAWQDVFAPAKTSNEIVQKISRDLAKALAEPSLVEKLGRNAYRVESSSPAELAKFLKTDTEKWETVIKTTGIKID
jgi:Tripartite tricarboxylate transporter family receptor